MDALISLHASQPWWIWLGLGLVLLAVESALSSEWLLWPAVSAGIVAVLTAIGLRYGFAVEIIAFGLLTAGLTLLSNRLIKRMNPVDMPDINSRPRSSRRFWTGGAGCSSRARNGPPSWRARLLRLSARASLSRPSRALG